MKNGIASHIIFSLKTQVQILNLLKHFVSHTYLIEKKYNVKTVCRVKLYCSVLSTWNGTFEKIVRKATMLLISKVWPILFTKLDHEIEYYFFSVRWNSRTFNHKVENKCVFHICNWTYAGCIVRYAPSRHFSLQTLKYREILCSASFWNFRRVLLIKVYIDIFHCASWNNGCNI